MAFLSKVGNILRQSLTQNVSSEVSPFKASTFLSIRAMCNMASSKVFVGGLSYQTDEQSFREAFAKYGQVVDARIITDRDTGRSRGFGFVTYASSEEASSAIQALDGQDLHGRRVRVNYATDRRASGGYSGGGGGGYGGYSGGGGGGYGGYSGGGRNYGGVGQNYNSNYGGDYNRAAPASDNYGGYGGNSGGYVGGGGGGNDGFSGRYDGSAGQGLGGAEEFTASSGNADVDRDEPVEGNVRDEDDTDFAKRA